MGTGRRRRANRASRPPMRSPGRPPGWRREHQQRFWEAIAHGLSSEEAAAAAGLSSAVGAQDRHFSFPKGEGKPNPHAWTNPRHAVEYADVVRQVLSERDPGNATYYQENFAAFSRLFEQFDAAMRKAFATIPEGNKKLLTYHDSFAYFARDYGWEVVGAIQVSDFSDPSPRKVAELIEQIRREDVPAIFGSEVFPSPVLEQIAAETGAGYVADLRDDDLPGEPGEPGDPDHSLIGLLRFDFATITRALGGDPKALEEFEVRNVAPDQAAYPQ